jgi:hypothetical protein
MSKITWLLMRDGTVALLSDTTCMVYEDIKGEAIKGVIGKRNILDKLDTSAALFIVHTGRNKTYVCELAKGNSDLIVLKDILTGNTLLREMGQDKAIKLQHVYRKEYKHVN